MNKITVQATIHILVDYVWEYWNQPEHITKWAFASDDWEAPHAENDLRVGGRFLTTMSAKDKSTSFNFEGTYTAVEINQEISYVMDDGRNVTILFENLGDSTKVTETFDPENENPVEMQRAGWQSILDNFKKYVESK